MASTPPQTHRRSPTDREITAKTDSDLLLRLAELSEPATSPFPWETQVTARVEPPAAGIGGEIAEPADELGFDRAPLSPMAARRAAEPTEPYVPTLGVHADPSAWVGDDAGAGGAGSAAPPEHAVGLDDHTPSEPSLAQPAATARIRAISRARRVAESDAEPLDGDTITTRPSAWRLVALGGMFGLGALLVALYHLLFGITAR